MRAVGYIAQWLERLSADQKVPGSNLGVPFLTRGPDARPKLRGYYSRVPPLAIVATLTLHPVEKSEQKCAFEEGATKTTCCLARIVLSSASLASWTRCRTSNPKIAGSSPAGGVSILVTLSHVCHPVLVALWARRAINHNTRVRGARTKWCKVLGKRHHFLRGIISVRQHARSARQSGQCFT